jgi:hypothetical protein
MASHKLSIDTTFDPCLFSLYSPFKAFAPHMSQHISNEQHIMWVTLWANTHPVAESVVAANLGLP